MTEINGYTVQTYHDWAGDPEWIATCGSVSDLLAVVSSEELPEFAAGGATESEAVYNLAVKNGWEGQLPLPMRKKAPEILNLYQVRLLLRKATVMKQSSADLSVLLCLFSHHPRRVTMATVMKETSLPRQTAHRALNESPGLIKVWRTLDDHRGMNPDIGYTLTRQGQEESVNYLRMLTK